MYTSTGRAQLNQAHPGASGGQNSRKAKWAAEIVQQRLKDRGFGYSEVRVDLIGMSSVHGMGQGWGESIFSSCTLL